MPERTTDTPRARVREATKQVAIAIEKLDDGSQVTPKLATIRDELERVSDELATADEDESDLPAEE